MIAWCMKEMGRHTKTFNIHPGATTSMIVVAISVPRTKPRIMYGADIKCCWASKRLWALVHTDTSGGGKHGTVLLRQSVLKNEKPLEDGRTAL